MSKPNLTTYGGKLAEVGYAGQVADFNPAVIESKVNESATPIDFGIAVCRGSADDTCKPQGADGDKILGISVRSLTMVADSSGNVSYAQRASVPIMRDGYIFAVALEATVPGDSVIAVVAQGGKLGSLTGGAAGAGRIAVPGASWETTTAAGEIGQIRINN